MATDEKERLSNNEFIELIPHLSIQDLLLVEYRISTWQSMLSITNTPSKLYRCNLCGITQYGIKNTSIHIDGKKHKAKMITVEQLFHPNYTYAKNQTGMAKGNIQEESNTKLLPKEKPPGNNDKKQIAIVPQNNVKKNASQLNMKKNVHANNSNVKVNAQTNAVNAKVINPLNKINKNIKKPINNTNSNLKKPLNSNAGTVPPIIPNIQPNVKIDLQKETNNASKVANVCKKSSNTTTKPITETNQIPTSIENKQVKENVTQVKPISVKQSTTKTSLSITPPTKPKTAIISVKQSTIKNSLITTPGTKPETAVISIKQSTMNSSSLTTPDTKPKTAVISVNRCTMNSTSSTTPDTKLKTAVTSVKQSAMNNSLITTPGTKPKTAVTSVKQSTMNSTSSTTPDPKPKTAVTSVKQSAMKNVSSTTPDTKPKTAVISVKQSNIKNVSSITPDTKSVTAVISNKNKNLIQNTVQESSKAVSSTIKSEVSETACKIQTNELNISDKEKSNKTTELSSNLPKPQRPVKCVKTQSNQKTDNTIKLPPTESDNKIKLSKTETDVSICIKKQKLDVDNFKITENENVLEKSTGDSAIKKEPNSENSDSVVVELEDPVVRTSNVRSSVPKKTPSINLKSISLLLNPNHKNKVQNAIHSESNEGNQIMEESANQKKPAETKEEKLSTDLKPKVIVIEDEVEHCESASTGENEGPPKKTQKLMLNPAAVVAAREAMQISTTNQSNSSRYISNKIIIPTKHKTPQNNTIISTNNIREEPSFAHKRLNLNTDDEIFGLIGVEYVIKIMKSRNDIAPRFECGLCELILDGCAMQNHLLGYSHRLKFCEKHFPSALRQYKQYMGSVPEHEEYKIMAPILDKLAIAIEKYHGRELPCECLDREFNFKRHEILTKVYSLRHATEQYGPSFTHVVSAKEVDELITQRHNYVYRSNPNARRTVFDKRQSNTGNKKIRCNQLNKPDYGFDNNFSNFSYETETTNNMNVNSNIFFEKPQWSNEIYSSTLDDETHKRMVESFLRKTARSTTDRRTVRSDLAHRSFDRNEYRSRSPRLSTITTARCASISPLRENDIWQAYRHLVDQKVTELNKVFETYRHDPEKHPMYNEEWQKFWKRRKDELIAAGLDHRTYNYQPEWVRFFEVRIEELYSEDIENLKIECRDRLCLPMTNDELIDSKYHVQAAAQKAECNDDTEIVTNEQKDVSKLYSKSDESFSNENTSKVVAVLRLVTALEDHLGSLGPKIIDLLAKALQVEKSAPENIFKIILTTENCFLLETVMEKFKGLLIANLLEGSKARALGKVVMEIDDLLKMAEEKRKKHCQSEESTLEKTISTKTVSETHTSREITKKTNTLSSDNINQTDKKELAAKLAAVLAAKGKTNLDTNELQELVSIYTTFEKKKRDAYPNTSSMTFTTNTFKSSNSYINQKSLSDTLVELQKTSKINASTAKVSQTSRTTERSEPSAITANNIQWCNTNNSSQNSVQLQSMNFNNAMQNQLSTNTYSRNYDLNMNTNRELRYSAQKLNSSYFLQGTANANGNFYTNNTTNVNNNNNNNNNNINNFSRPYMQAVNTTQEYPQQQQQQQAQNTQSDQQSPNFGFGFNRFNQNWMLQQRYQTENPGGLNSNHNSDTERNHHSGWRRN